MSVPGDSVPVRFAQSVTKSPEYIVWEDESVTLSFFSDAQPGAARTTKLRMKAAIEVHHIIAVYPLNTSGNLVWPLHPVGNGSFRVPLKS